jgi:hypothetical protein
MRRSRIAAVVVVVVLTVVLSGQVWALEKPAVVAAPAPAAAPAKPKLLPEVNFNGVSLEDVVGFLHDVDPSFQAVIVRDPDVPAEYPVIQNLKLKKVSINQLMTVLQKLFPYDSEIIEEETGGPAVTVLRVHNPEGTGLGGPVRPTAVQVFRLADAVDAMVVKAGKDRGDQAAMKEATGKVLSAVNALLTLQGAAASKAPPVVQIHEDTQTLLVKGTAEQLTSVGALLDTLQPQPEVAKVAALKKQLAEAQDARGEQLGRAEGARAGIQSQLDSAMTTLREREKELLQKNAELERLKLELQSVLTERRRGAAGDAPKRGGGGGGAAAPAPDGGARSEQAEKRR